MIDLQAMLTPEYQGQLNEADKLAVHVGGNQPLRCVVFERREDAAVWLQANHGVQNNPITATGHEWLLQIETQPPSDQSCID